MRLVKSSTKWCVVGRLDQHDGAVCIWETEKQELALEFADLLVREIHNTSDQLTNQPVRCVMHSNLG